MDPLCQLVAYLLLTARPDDKRQALSFNASANASPPPGVPLRQLVRAVETRGAAILRTLLKTLNRANSKNTSSSAAADGAREAKSNNNDGNDDDDDGGDDARQVNGADSSDDDEQQQQQQQNGGAAANRLTLNAVWPRTEMPEQWVPRIVQQLMALGAVVNENAGIENRHPLIRLTPASFAAAYNALILPRHSVGARTIAPTEVERRQNMNANSKKSQRRKRQQQAKARAEKPDRTLRKLATIKQTIKQKRRAKKGGGGGGAARSTKKRPMQRRGGK